MRHCNESKGTGAMTLAMAILVATAMLACNGKASEPPTGAKAAAPPKPKVVKEEPAPEKKAGTKVDVAQAREVFDSLKALSQKGEASALAPFLYDRRARAFIGRMKAADLATLFDGTVTGHEINGGRVLFQLDGNPRFKVAAMFLTSTGYKYDPLVSRGYKDPNPGARDPLNTPVPLAEAVAGIEGNGRLTATLDTSMGVIQCELFEKQAPVTVANFVSLARGLRGFFDKASGQWVKRPFYDGLGFHRVIPRFMIQGGCPQGTGQGGPGYSFTDEFDLSLRHDRPGRLSKANSGPNTNGSQFFITEVPTPWLDDHHTIFGQCEPASLVKKIGQVPATSARPREPITVQSVKLSRRTAGQD